MDDKTRDDLILALARWITEGGPDTFAALQEAKKRAMAENTARAVDEVIEATERSEC